MRASNGCSCAMRMQRESMVWILSLCGCSSSCHPRASSWASAFLAVSRAGSYLPLRAFSSCCKIRERISAVAARVKVMARTCSGSSTSASSFKKRCVRSSVFPDPAGACTMQEIAVFSASSRWAWSGGTNCSLLIVRLLSIRGQVKLGDSAESRQWAILAGLWPFFRVYGCFAAQKLFGQTKQRALPTLSHFAVVRLVHQWALGRKTGFKLRLRVRHVTCKFCLPCADFSEEQSAHVLNIAIDRV